MPDISGTLSPIAMKVINRYGNGLQFAKTFNPDLQRICALSKERSFLGDAPSIAALMQAYPEKQVTAWIMAQLENLNDFTGVNNKIEPRQMKELAGIIEADYYFLKASELLLFFHMLKAGEFGIFYGNVDPMVIARSLFEFRTYRRQQIEFYEREIKQKQKQEELDRWQKNAVPCPDHCKLARNYIEQLESE